MAAVGEYIEGLCLDARLVDGRPLQVVLGELRICRVALVLAHGLDGSRAILGLLGAGDIGQAGRM